MMLFSGVRSPRSALHCQIGFASRTHAARKPLAVPVALSRALMSVFASQVTIGSHSWPA
jgi:hypothetical protein